nr:MAG TPA: hypothetical protein [Caudoviricetes sp.]
MLCYISSILWRRIEITKKNLSRALAELRVSYTAEQRSIP